MPDKFKQPQPTVPSVPSPSPGQRPHPNAAIPLASPSPLHAHPQPLHAHPQPLHPSQSAPNIIVPQSHPAHHHLHSPANHTAPRVAISVTADGFSSAVPINANQMVREQGLMGGLATSFLGGLSIQAGK